MKIRFMCITSSDKTTSTERRADYYLSFTDNASLCKPKLHDLHARITPNSHVYLNVFTANRKK